MPYRWDGGATRQKSVPTGGKTNSAPTKPESKLYDLEQDPKELKNVYSDPAYAKVVAELKAELRRLKNELGDTEEQSPELLNPVFLMETRTPENAPRLQSGGFEAFLNQDRAQ